MKKRILFTARDVGAAHQIKYISDAFRQAGHAISVVAGDPAYAVLKEYGLEVQHFSVKGRSSIRSDPPKIEMDELLGLAKKVMLEKKSDAVFCGLSTSNYGIDEAAMYWASSKRMGIPSFQFLDTWGTFNHLRDGYPDLYFAIDHATEYLGSMGARAPMRVVGSPKHYFYSQEPVSSWRRDARARLGVRKDQKLIGYFGQDPDVRGHTLNFRAFVDSVLMYMKKNPGGCLFLMRPHPAYEDKYASYWRYLKKSGLEVVDAAGERHVERTICSCDVVATCYSTVAVDHAYLSACSKGYIGSVIYLLAGESIKRHLSAHFGYWKTPLLENGVGYCACSAAEMGPALTSMLEDAACQRTYFEKAKTLQTADPCRKIMDVVLPLLTG